MKSVGGRIAIFTFSLFLHVITANGRPAVAADISLVDGLGPGQKGILIQGPIEIGDSQRFYELSQQAERAVVFLESPGGSVEEGLSIGAEIALKGFTTLVLDGDGCHSICAIIWVSGVRRYMSSTADISVHAAYRVSATESGEFEVSESGMANATIGAFLSEIGLGRRAIEYFTAARPDETLLPITPEIGQFLDIDIYVYEGERLITPADRPTPERIAEQVGNYMGLLANCAELFDVNPQFWRARAEIVLSEGHALFGPELFGELISLQVSTTRQALDRNGTVRWCLNAETNLRTDALDTGIYGPSFDCGLASTPTETAICDSQQLWALDTAVARVYFMLRQSVEANHEAQLVSEQRAWLDRRNQCGSDQECLTERYWSRLFDFGG